MGFKKAGAGVRPPPIRKYDLATEGLVDIRNNIVDRLNADG